MINNSSSNNRSSSSFGAKRSFGGSSSSFRKPGFSGGRSSSGSNSRFVSNGRRPFGRFNNGRRNNPYRGENIRHEMYVSKAVNSITSVDAMYDKTVTFSDFGLHPKLLSNISFRKYVHPTTIQSQVMPHILDKKDIIGMAATGSGKTAAFLIPIINAVLKDPKKKALIIAPTRELVNQIQEELRKFAHGTFINDVLIVGGASYYTQLKLLRRNHNFVMATPGRLIDLFKQNQVDLGSFDLIVLDEVDQMLDMGFINDVKTIVSKLKEDKQSLFFSATLSPKIREIAKALLKDPVTFELEHQSAAKNVDQDIVKVAPGKQKIDTLHDILVNADFERVLVFAKTKRGADDVAHSLRRLGHRADALHGNKSLSQRTRILSMFKRSEIEILVATDVASRGIDVPDISHVINYDEPATYADYIHRIGRTGRIGKKGKALTFVSSKY